MEIKLPARTGATDLSEDEMLLLDAIFQCTGIATHQLISEQYAFHMNSGYTHHIANHQIVDTLQSLRTRHILVSEADDETGSTQWYLTQNGGLLWEAERRPIWDRYVTTEENIGTFSDDMDREWEFGIDDETGWAEPVLAIRSPGVKIAEKYLETAVACKIHIPRNSDRLHVIKNDFSDFSFKVFPKMRCLYVPTAPESVEEAGMPIYHPIDWTEYERRRVWWRSIDELDSLRKKLD